MHKEQFDYLIREKLSNLTLAYQPRDWESMAQRLDWVFDAHLRQKLQDLNLPYDPQSWEKLAQKLDQTFDEGLRKKLEALKEEKPTESWPILAALLAERAFDAALLRKLFTLSSEADPSEAEWQELLRELEADAFFTSLRQKLDTLSIEGHLESDWLEMQSLMDRAFDQQLEKKLSELPPEIPSQHHWMAIEEAFPNGNVDQALREKLDNPALPWLEVDRSEDWDRLEATLFEPSENLLRDRIDSLSADERPEWERMNAILSGESTTILASSKVSKSSKIGPRYWAAAVLVLLFMVGGFLDFKSDQLSKSVAQLAQDGLENQDDSNGLDRSADSSDPTLQLGSSDWGNPSLAKADNNQSAFVTKVSSTISVDRMKVSHETLVNASLPEKIFPLQDSPFAREEKVNSQPHKPGIAPVTHKLGNSFRLASPTFTKKLNMAMLVPPDDHPADVRLGLSLGFASTKAELSGRTEKLGYQGGLRVEFNIDQSWQVISGLAYSQKHFTYDGVTNPKNTNGRTLPYALDGSLKLVELPLMIRYRFTTEEPLSLYLQGGILSALSLVESYEHYSPENPTNAFRVAYNPRQLEPEQRDWNLNSYPANIIVGIGLEYQVNDHIFLQVEPYFLQSLQRTKGSGTLNFEKNLYTTGVNGNIIFDLKAD